MDWDAAPVVDAVNDPDRVPVPDTDRDVLGEVVAVLDHVLVVDVDPSAVDDAVPETDVVPGSDAVSDCAAVDVASMDVMVVTGGQISGVPALVSAEQSETLAASFEATLSLRHQFTAEGDTGHVLAFATFTDGGRMALTQSNANVTIGTVPHLPTTVEVNGWQVTVPVNAVSGCERYVRAEWSVCNGGGLTTIAGYGVVHVDLPAATGVDLYVSRAVITRSSDPAASSPISLPTSAVLTCRVHFEDGTSKDFSMDSRTVYTVTAGSDMALINGQAVESIDGASGHGVVSVAVSFPGVYPSISDTVTVTVSVLQSLELTALNYPLISSGASVSTLYRVQCAGVWQRAQMVLVATRTDGPATAVTNHATFVSDDPNVVSVTGSTLIGQSVGVAQIQATFGATASATLNMTVSGASVSVSAVQLSHGLASGTLLGEVGTTQVVGVRVSFSDGTYFSDVVGGVSWIVPSALGMSFSTAWPGTVSISGGGVLTLHNNYYTSVDVTASVEAQCTELGSTLTSTVGVFCNLRPSIDGELDLGGSVGAPVGVASVGGRLSVQVWMEARLSALLAFQLIVTFDSNVLSPVSGSCVIGAGSSGSNNDGWDDVESKDFACTTHSPVDEVLILGQTTQTTAVGGAIHLATFELLATGAGVHSFGGVVERAVHVGGDQTDMLIANTSADISVQIMATRKRKQPMTHGKATEFHAAPDALARRRARGAGELQRTKQDGTCQMLGDVNLDCRFDVADVLFSNYVVDLYLGYEFASLTVWQRQQLYPRSYGYDGDITNRPQLSVADVGYLFKVAARKYRFVRSFHVESVPSSVSIMVGVVDGEGLGVSVISTSVQMIINTVHNRDVLDFHVGTLTQTHPTDGLVVSAQLVDDNFTVAATGDTVAEANVGVALIVVVTQGDGSQDVSYLRFTALSGGATFDAFGTFDVLQCSPSPSVFASASQSTSWTSSASASASYTASGSVSRSPSRSSSGSSSQTQSHSPSITVTASLSPSAAWSASVTVTSSHSSTYSSSAHPSSSITGSLSSSSSPSGTTASSPSETVSTSTTSSPLSSYSPSLSTATPEVCPAFTPCKVHYFPAASYKWYLANATIKGDQAFDSAERSNFVTAVKLGLSDIGCSSFYVLEVGSSTALAFWVSLRTEMPTSRSCLVGQVDLVDPAIQDRYQQKTSFEVTGIFVTEIIPAYLNMSYSASPSAGPTTFVPVPSAVVSATSSTSSVGERNGTLDNAETPISNAGTNLDLILIIVGSLSSAAAVFAAVVVRSKKGGARDPKQILAGKLQSREVPESSNAPMKFDNFPPLTDRNMSAPRSFTATKDQMLSTRTGSTMISMRSERFSPGSFPSFNAASGPTTNVMGGAGGLSFLDVPTGSPGQGMPYGLQRSNTSYIDASDYDYSLNMRGSFFDIYDSSHSLGNKKENDDQHTVLMNMLSMAKQHRSDLEAAPEEKGLKARRNLHRLMSQMVESPDPSNKATGPASLEEGSLDGDKDKDKNLGTALFTRRESHEKHHEPALPGMRRSMRDLLGYEDSDASSDTDGFESEGEDGFHDHTETVNITKTKQRQGSFSPASMFKKKVPSLKSISLAQVKPAQRNTERDILETVEMEAQKVFQWMHQRGGVVTTQDLIDYLHLSRPEADNLIVEAKVAVHGNARSSSSGHGCLDDKEFVNIFVKHVEEKMLEGTTEELSHVPPRILRRWRTMFDGIDTDGSGTISFDEFASDMPEIAHLKDLIKSLLHGRTELTFNDFAKLLHRSETGRAGRVLQSIMAEVPEGKRLADALKRATKSKSRPETRRADEKKKKNKDLSIESGSQPSSPVQRTLMPTASTGHLSRSGSRFGRSLSRRHTSGFLTTITEDSNAAADKGDETKEAADSNGQDVGSTIRQLQKSSESIPSISELQGHSTSMNSSISSQNSSISNSTSGKIILRKTDSSFGIRYGHDSQAWILPRMTSSFQGSGFLEGGGSSSIFGTDRDMAVPELVQDIWKQSVVLVGLGRADRDRLLESLMKACEQGHILISDEDFAELVLNLGEEGQTYTLDEFWSLIRPMIPDDDGDFESSADSWASDISVPTFQVGGKTGEEADKRVRAAFESLRQSLGPAVDTIGKTHLIASVTRGMGDDHGVSVFLINLQSIVEVHPEENISWDDFLRMVLDAEGFTNDELGHGHWPFLDAMGAIYNPPQVLNSQDGK